MEDGKGGKEGEDVYPTCEQEINDLHSTGREESACCARTKEHARNQLEQGSGMKEIFGNFKEKV